MTKVAGFLLSTILFLTARLFCLSDGPLAISVPTIAGASVHAPKADLAKLPLRFEANLGQFDERVRFVARDRGIALFLTDDSATLALRKSKSHDADAVLALHIIGARASRPAGTEPLETKSNYFIGNDPTQWRTNVPNFRRTRYASVLPGVDLVYYGDGGSLEYDVVVAPGTSLDGVAMQIDGSDRLAVGEDGQLEVHTSAGVLTQPKPHV